MEKIQFFLLVSLFLLQSINNNFVIVFSTLLLLIVTVFITQNKIKLKAPLYFQIAGLIYLVFVFVGILNHHHNMQVDIKFQLYSFLFYLYLINQKNINFINLLFIINIIVFVIYMLLYFDYMPNFWSDSTFGYMGRMYGPVIIAYIFSSFLYIFKNRPFDKKLGLSFILAISYILLTTNFMNLIIVIGLTFLNIVDIHKILKPKYILIIVSMTILGIGYVQSPYAIDLVKRKASYIFAPWEYGSIKTRIEDFNQAINVADFGIKEKLIGVGFGTSTIINRGKDYSGNYQIRNFQEIDNGFYYLYHRGGWILLLIFITTHIWLLLKLPNLNSKFGFTLIVVGTNLLSIHYFNYYFYLIIPYLIISEGKKISLLYNRKKIKIA